MSDPVVRPRSGAEVGLGRAFAHDRPALVAYLMAGYPDRDGSLEALRAVTRAGADLIELGVPYGDPLADGRVIRDAGYATLDTPGGFGLAEALELAREFTSATDEVPPLALMTYVNPMLALGFEEVVRKANDAGVSGFIIPDLPADAADVWLAAAGDLDTAFLVAPTSTDERLDVVVERASGFVYCVSSLGVTGERAALSKTLPTLVARVKERTDLPVAVGFGIGTPEKAREVATFADGVVVGSAIVRRQHDIPELEAFVATLAEAVHSAA